MATLHLDAPLDLDPLDRAPGNDLEGTVSVRTFMLGDVPGLLWTPRTASPSSPVRLVLQGHPGDLTAGRERLEARARAAAALGFASAALEVPGSGTRPRLPAVDAARAELRGAMLAGEPVPDDVVDRLVLPLVEASVPELQDALDALLALPELEGPVGWSGGIIAIGTGLAAVEPRVRAVVLYAGTFVPRSIIAQARDVTAPVHVLLQWDDAGNDRQAALDLFDALGASEKTLQANLGGHTGVPAFAAAEANRFLLRHLGAPQHVAQSR